MSRGTGRIAELCEALSYEFSRPELLELALTHASAASSAADSYERLEFLGDRVLGLAVADLLMVRFPDEKEGALARRLAGLVDRHSLAEIAIGLDLGAYVRLSPGESASGIRENRTVLSDVMEAVIGAIYRDGGLSAVEPIVTRLWTALIERDEHPPVDAKTALQELVQGKGAALPRYETIDRSGPDHRPSFTVEVVVDGHRPVRGEGTSKRAAERDAAERLLRALQDEHVD